MNDNVIRLLRDHPDPRYIRCPCGHLVSKLLAWTEVTETGETIRGHRVCVETLPDDAA